MASMLQCRWYGPAVVIGIEGPSFWVSYRGIATKCAREHLRLASADELRAFDMISVEAGLLYENVRGHDADEDLE